MSEYFDIRDWDGNPTGEKKERGQVHRDGDIHGTSHVWIFRKNEKTGSADVLLQKRAPGKDAFPGCYDTSSAGHIPAGGSCLETALRELREELGVHAKPSELQYLFLHRQTVDTEFCGERFFDRQVSAVYLYVRDIQEEEFCLQEEEVESILWMDYKECEERVNRRDPGYCICPEEYQQVCEHVEKEILRSKPSISPTWNEDCLAELDEWIESQGIYLRQ